VKIGVSLKIDVTKIDKDRLFKGEKGTYLNATVFIDVDEKDQYGNNGFIAQSVSKEEREAGVRGNILGDVRVFTKDKKGHTPPSVPQSQAMSGFDDFDDDVPF